MTMEPRQVKVDNWGIFFLQRLKHFFNRTDYCDLTLQFQDNAQLKVHRLVLSACTEYFELLERTCEMYEDCLVMPDDLQADVVVPIVNFMYTGQLEFKMDTLERLYQTSLVMNMPVLTKLLDSHRSHYTQVNREKLCHSYSNTKRLKSHDSSKHYSTFTPSSSNATNKRSYSKAFANTSLAQKYRKIHPSEMDEITPYTNSVEHHHIPKKQVYLEPRPTRYELPEELESDNLFDNSFTNISYTSKPLMVHPETSKRYPAKRPGIFEDPSTSKQFIHGHSTMDIVECKKISPSENIFDDDPSENMGDEGDTYGNSVSRVQSRNSSQLFDQILDSGGPKVTIETKDSKQASNLDHAKIISEVLKKYPHLVKSNKNIKLKILNTPTKKKVLRPPSSLESERELKSKPKIDENFAFETDIMDSKAAGKLIAMGAENIKGPWLCLICGAPGKAINFTSYYKYRRHLVEVHNEKPITSMCEYCGQKATKRNFMQHHIYSKHGVEPTGPYHFPKCNICNYIALNERILVKHKLSHVENQIFRCNICATIFATSQQLLVHIQKTGHKYSDKKTVLQCIYCQKVFTREHNLYAHLLTCHKESARSDGIIDMSEDEREDGKEKILFNHSPKQNIVKYEVPVSFENEYDDADIQYQIQQQPDGNIQVASKKPKVLLPARKHKILNAGFDSPTSTKLEEKQKISLNSPSKHIEFVQNTNIPMNNSTEEIVLIDNQEYIIKDDHLYPKKDKPSVCQGFSMPDLMHTGIEEHSVIPTSIEYTNQDHKTVVKKSGPVNQPIQIVVSNEEEYKALMASNHSIIFEDGDSNKTLTVLTAPHENNTTIDLDNSQSNDMMILPDNYPLNVSQAVSGDNSNIVVVYSHTVDDQNKEFQLNLGTQYVSTSGIITQNYETVTTSAPVMTTRIIETPVDESWQNSASQNIATDTEMEMPLNDSEETIIQQSSIDNIQDMQMIPDNSVCVEGQPNSENNCEPAIHNSIPETNNPIVNETESIVHNSQPDGSCNKEVQPTYISCINSAPIATFSETENNHDVRENVDTEQPNEGLNNKEKVSDENIVHENSMISQEVVVVPAASQQILSDIPSTDANQSTDLETIENIAKEIQYSAAESSTPIDTVVHTSVITNPTGSVSVTSTKAKEQIKSLTSEWSDDEMPEMETEPVQVTLQEDETQKDTLETEAMETDSQTDVEESIENIQHEMEKQMNHPTKSPTVLQKIASLTENEDDTSGSDNLLSIQDIEPVDKIVQPNESIRAPVKIASLLNDWEDNDSQEENSPAVVENKNDEESIHENVMPISIENNTNEMAVIETNTVIKKPQTNPNENIESLVSDWVEDDEEEPENV